MRQIIAQPGWYGFRACQQRVGLYTRLEPVIEPASTGDLKATPVAQLVACFQLSLFRVFGIKITTTPSSRNGISKYLRPHFCCPELKCFKKYIYNCDLFRKVKGLWKLAIRPVWDH